MQVVWERNRKLFMWRRIMQKAIRFVGELIPGFVLALAIATVAYFTAQIQVGENVHGKVTIGS